MQKPIVNYDTLLKITKAISVLRDPDEIVLVELAKRLQVIVDVIAAHADGHADELGEAFENLFIHLKQTAIHGQEPAIAA